MIKKSKSKLLNEKNEGVKEIKYHFSLIMKILLFFTFIFWIIPFIFINIKAALKMRESLQRYPKAGPVNEEGYNNVERNSLEFYNQYLTVKKANKKLFLTKEQWSAMNVQDIEIETFDNKKLSAFVIKAVNPTNKWVIVCHGWGQNRFSILYLAMPFYHAGYNVLVYDFRNHGSNPYTSCTFGINESQDLFYVTKYLNEEVDREVQKDIVLIGNSMGASTVLMALQKYDLTPLGVKCAIFDCGYDNFAHMGKILIQKTVGIHWFWAFYGVKYYSLWKDKFNIDHINLAAKMNFVSKTPILFIHGTNDNTVPVTMSENLYNLKIETEKFEKTKSKLVLFEKTEHIESIISDYKKYEKEVLSFVKKYLK